MSRVISNQVAITLLSRRVALPFDFGSVNVIFDMSMRVHLKFNSCIRTIQLLILQLTVIDLTLSLNTFALIQKRHKAVWKIRLNIFSDSPILYSSSLCETSVLALFLRGTARCWRTVKPIISNKVLLPFQRTFTIFVPCGNAGHTTTAHNERFCVSGGVTRPKVSTILQVSYPAQAAVSRHPRKAARTLEAMRENVSSWNTLTLISTIF